MGPHSHWSASAGCSVAAPWENGAEYPAFRDEHALAAGTCVHRDGSAVPAQLLRLRQLRTDHVVTVVQ